jgi:predicted NBD/HSP70 family sugar kinase
LQQVVEQTGRPALTWEEVVEAAQAGDTQMEGILWEAGRQLGAAVAYLVGGLNIRQIVIGGQMTRAGEPFLAGVRVAVRGRVLPAIAAGTEIGYTTLGDDMVLMGASALVLKERLGVI